MPVKGVTLMDVVLRFVLVCVGIAIYFFPAILANRRKAKHEVSIFWVNLLLGWTVIGWCAALVWTVAETTPELMPEKWLQSWFGRWVTEIINRFTVFVPDDKRKGRVQFRRNDSDTDFLG